MTGFVPLSVSGVRTIGLIIVVDLLGVAKDLTRKGISVVEL